MKKVISKLLNRKVIISALALAAAVAVSLGNADVAEVINNVINALQPAPEAVPAQ